MQPFLIVVEHFLGAIYRRSMALRLRSNGLSNEAIYRENWASYVDSAISRHQSSGAQGVGDPIDLRDVMRLEELLSKIKHAAGATGEGGGQALGTSTHVLLKQQETENKAPARTRDNRCDGARPRGKGRYAWMFSCCWCTFLPLCLCCTRLRRN